MNSYSAASKRRLNSCHDDLQELFKSVLEDFDHTIICGHRNKREQDEAVAGGKSKTPYPHSKHNPMPSLAVDAAPFDKDMANIDWNDRVRMCYFAGVVMERARAMGINLRWGGDWDRDTELKDNRFNDLVHFELI